MLLDKIQDVENKILRRVLFVLYVIAVTICLPFKTLYEIFKSNNTITLIKYVFAEYKDKLYGVKLFW